MNPTNGETSLGSLSGVAAALEPLRAASDAAGLAREVCGWLASTVAVVCRVDRFGVGGPTMIARAVTEDRADVRSPSDDLAGDAAAAGVFDVVPDSGRQLSWVAVPLQADEGKFGVLRLALELSTGLTAADLTFLHRIGDSLAAGLVGADLHKHTERVSVSLQRSLLPSALPSGPWFDLAAQYVPATAGLQIGGDWYDAEVLPSGNELAISVGDVAGHGVEAAARMGDIRSAMSTLRQLSEAPDALISLLHRRYASSNFFATAICARLDRSGELRWSSAGHLPPVVAHAGGGAELATGRQSPPLGVGVEGTTVVELRELGPGDAVLLYTDGLVERRKESLDTGLANLVAIVGEAPSLEPEHLVEHVVQARQASGPIGDDIAVLTARFI